ncbi:MAG: thiamine pyrophosphate-binding protein [Devosia sp.]|nr:thiamine pyrophosphate-binding protein [Devosia sp.]
MDASPSKAAEAAPDRLFLTGGEALARVLRSCGIANIYGVVGGAFAPFLGAVSRSNELRYVGVRHEASGGFMAAAEFYSTGRLAVCIGEQGPGGLNLLSGLGTAFNNNLALLAITTNVPLVSAYPHEGKLMDANHKRLYEGLTKWNAVVNDVSRLPALVRMAVRAALTGCPAPVHLDIPGDMLVESHEFSIGELDLPMDRFLPSGRSPAPQPAVARAAELLQKARRPLVIAGGGVTHSEAQAPLLALLDGIGAAATATMTGIGAIPSDHPGFIGHSGVIGGPVIARAMREADVILAIGCRFSSYMWDGAEQTVRGWPEQDLIQIDIDPERLGRAAPLAVGLLGDARAVLEQLLAALGSTGPSAAAASWRRELAAAFATYTTTLTAAGDWHEGLIHPAALARRIGAFLGTGGLVVLDGGHTCFWGNALTPVAAPRTRFNDACMAQLGFGTPFAIGLKHLHPNQTVVNITGDGSFGFTLAELDTARRHGLPVINIIHNNASWGIIRAGQNMHGFELGADLAGTDYAAVARAFGCFGERVTDPDEIEPALRRAIASNLPAVLDVQVAFVPHPQMAPFGRMGLAQPRSAVRS